MPITEDAIKALRKAESQDTDYESELTYINSRIENIIQEAKDTSHHLSQNFKNELPMIGAENVKSKIKSLDSLFNASDHE